MTSDQTASPLPRPKALQSSRRCWPGRSTARCPGGSNYIKCPGGSAWAVSFCDKLRKIRQPLDRTISRSRYIHYKRRPTPAPHGRICPISRNVLLFESIYRLPVGRLFNRRYSSTAPVTEESSDGCNFPSGGYSGSSDFWLYLNARKFSIIKSVAKVLGQLSDSRTSYIYAMLPCLMNVIWIVASKLLTAPSGGHFWLYLKIMYTKSPLIRHRLTRMSSKCHPRLDWDKGNLRQGHDIAFSASREVCWRVDGDTEPTHEDSLSQSQRRKNDTPGRDSLYLMQLWSCTYTLLS